jgi:hypothetical protein
LTGEITDIARVGRGFWVPRGARILHVDGRAEHAIEPRIGSGGQSRVVWGERGLLRYSHNAQLVELLDFGGGEGFGCGRRRP